MDLLGKPGPSGSGTALSSEALAQLRSRARVLLGEPGASPTNVEAVHILPESSDAPATRRQALRRKTMISGKLVFGEMSSVIDCFVRDLSDTGARLSLPTPTPLPPVFMLRFNNGEYHRCRIKRRAGLEIGVQFLD